MSLYSYLFDNDIAKYAVVALVWIILGLGVARLIGANKGADDEAP